MPFTIVAECQAVSIFNRRTSPREALFLASSRVQDGAEKVWVYDQAWRFVSASVLADAARQQAGELNSVLRKLDRALADLSSLELQPRAGRNGNAVA